MQVASDAACHPRLASVSSKDAMLLNLVTNKELLPRTSEGDNGKFSKLCLGNHFLTETPT
jgi:hypothetical protein